MSVRVTLSESELVRVRLALLRAKDYWMCVPGQGARLLCEDYQRIYDLLCGSGRCDKEECNVGRAYEGDDPRHV